MKICVWTERAFVKTIALMMRNAEMRSPISSARLAEKAKVPHRDHHTDTTPSALSSASSSCHAIEFNSPTDIDIGPLSPKLRFRNIHDRSLPPSPSPLSSPAMPSPPVRLLSLAKTILLALASIHSASRLVASQLVFNHPKSFSLVSIRPLQRLLTTIGRRYYSRDR